jgi:hypothetical protein
MTAEQDAMARLAAVNPVHEDPLSSRALFLERAVLARPRPARRRRWQYAALPAGLAAAVATGIVVANRPAPPPPPVPAPALALPRTILTEAAQHAEQAPRRGRFVHVTGTTGRVVHIDSAGGYDLIRVDSVRSVRPADGLPGEGWLAIGESGSSVRPLTAADAAAYARDGSPDAAAVPGADQPLHPDLAGDSGYRGDVTELPGEHAPAGDGGLPAPPDPQGWLFREGTKLLDTFTDVVGGGDRAKVFRMLARLTGVRTLDAAADPLGRPALGLSYTEQTPRYGLIDWQVYLGAGSDRITYTQAVVRRPGPANASLTPGAVQYSTAVTSVTWSDTP